MKKMILGSVLYLLAAMSAFGAGYYEERVSACDAASMRQAMDSATARTGAGITVVRCESAPVAHVTRPAPRPVYVQPVEYIDWCCDC